MSKLCLLRVVDRWTGMLEQATWDVLEEEDRLIQKRNDICMCCAWDSRHTGIKNCWLNRLIVKTWWCWPLYFLFTRMESYLLEPSFKNHFTDCYQNPISLLLTASPFSPSWLEEQGPVLFFFCSFCTAFFWLLHFPAHVIVLPEESSGDLCVCFFYSLLFLLKKPNMPVPFFHCPGLSRNTTSTR